MNENSNREASISIQSAVGGWIVTVDTRAPYRDPYHNQLAGMCVPTSETCVFSNRKAMLRFIEKRIGS